MRVRVRVRVRARVRVRVSAAVRAEEARDEVVLLRLRAARARV